MFLPRCDKDWITGKKYGGKLKGLALNFTNNSGELSVYLILRISFMFLALTVYNSKASKPYHNFTGIQCVFNAAWRAAMYVGGADSFCVHGILT
jgi:hypothetical protein